MNQFDIDRLEQIFHTRPFITQGNRKGVIVKLPTFYLKIYEGTSDYTYSIQVWLYGKQLPTIVDEVRYDDLDQYMRNVSCRLRDYIFS